jgi:hypothetical protein
MYAFSDAKWLDGLLKETVHRRFCVGKEGKNMEASSARFLCFYLCVVNCMTFIR